MKFRLILLLSSVIICLYSKAQKEAGHDYVDMGTGTFWAICNVGAKDVTDPGMYLAWGEIAPPPNKDYNVKNCKLNKQNVANISGNVKYDAARANWGGHWRLPSVTDFKKLIDVCNIELIKINDKPIYKITSSITNNFIYIPLGGFFVGTELGDYEISSALWTSTPADDTGSQEYRYAQCVGIKDGNITVGGTTRKKGFNIRPVISYLDMK